MPGNIREVQGLIPCYEEIAGWPEDISMVRHLTDLPDKTRDYVKWIEDLTDTPVMLLSVGPGREETLLLKNPFTK